MKDVKVTVVETLNAQVVKWQNRFDAKPDISALQFQEKDGILSISNIALCETAKLDCEDILFGDEVFQLLLKDNEVLRIFIKWPFEKEPFVKLVEKVTTIYNFKENE